MYCLAGRAAPLLWYICLPFTCYMCKDENQQRKPSNDVTVTGAMSAASPRQSCGKETFALESGNLDKRFCRLSELLRNTLQRISRLRKRKTSGRSTSRPSNSSKRCKGAVHDVDAACCKQAPSIASMLSTGHDFGACESVQPERCNFFVSPEPTDWIKVAAMVMSTLATATLCKRKRSTPWHGQRNWRPSARPNSSRHKMQHTVQRRNL